MNKNPKAAAYSPVMSRGNMEWVVDDSNMA